MNISCPDVCVCKLTVDCLLLTVAHTLHQHTGTLCDIFYFIGIKVFVKTLLQSVAVCCIWSVLVGRMLYLCVGKLTYRLGKLQLTQERVQR